MGSPAGGAVDLTMASPARKPATYEDLLKLPEDKIGEIVDGDLYASPRPAGPHASCAFTLSSEIVRAEPFDAMELDLLRLWGEERPPQAG